MKSIGSRDFQLTYQKLEEPVKVISRSSNNKIIGYFYPGATPPVFAVTEPETVEKMIQEEMTLDDVFAEIPEQDRRYMERKLAKRSKK